MSGAKQQASERAELLQVVGLQKCYNVPVLEDFNFSLRRGEVHALVGSNGAGKSTFARILAGLTPRDSGEIRFDGRPYDPGSKLAAEREGVIMALQELNVIGTLSIAENIFLNPAAASLRLSSRFRLARRGAPGAGASGSRRLGSRDARGAPGNRTTTIGRNRRSLVPELPTAHFGRTDSRADRT